MLFHHLLSIYRGFLRHKVSFIINIVGLSMALVSLLFLFLWIDDELKVDHFLEGGDRLYQVMQNIQVDSDVQTIEATPGLLGKTLAAEIPQIEWAVSVIPSTFNAAKGTIGIGHAYFKVAGQYVTTNFLHAFHYRLLAGDPGRALSDRKNIVLSEKLALQLFPSVEDALGQPLEWKSQDIKESCVVSGVFESTPYTATRKFDFLLSYDLFESINPSDGWANSSPHTYVLLQDGASQQEVDEAIRDLIKRHDSNSHSTIFLQSYAGRYLYGQYADGKPIGGRIWYVKLFLAIGILILLIACVNYMNLSTARALMRMKDIGIRKTIGANRRTLATFYLMESVSLSIISLAFAILITDLLLNQFNLLTGKHITWEFNTSNIVVILTLTVLTGLLAGSYPAFYLSNLRPESIFKGGVAPDSRNLVARKGMIIFQLITTIVLIMGVGVVYRQVTFIQNKNLGFKGDQVLYFGASGLTKSVLAEIRSIPGVLNAGGGRLLSGNRLGGSNGLNWQGKTNGQDLFVSNLWMSPGLIETIDLKMISGRPFSDGPGIEDQIIFNEEAIKRMGLTNPVGEVVDYAGQRKTIIGVVKDFHFESLYEPIKPCALLCVPVEFAPQVSVKIQAGSELNTIAALQKLLKSRYPDEPFSYNFMDDDYKTLYAAESRISVLIRYFAILASVICGIGLYGLATFNVERRRKEIGVRKALGSSANGIVLLLSGEYARLVAIAFTIGIPISYYTTQQWLASFAFKIPLTWWLFPLTGAGTLLLVLLSTLPQALSAAQNNPIECLRSE